MVHRSTNRVNHFNKYFSLTKDKPVSNVTKYNDSANYFMSYSVGTPPVKLYGILDTGSNLVWFQCKPCDTCLNQTSPLYNPSKSSSYKNIHRSSRKCKSETGIHTSCSHNEDVCEYTATYGSGMSKGDLIEETLTFDSISNSSVSFPKTVMGCGHNNTMAGGGENPSIVGLGGSQFSLAKQLGSSIGGKFSYCLTSPFGKFNQSTSSSKLNFGDVAIVSGEEVVSTPFARHQLGYLLTLKAFSVGNKRIKYGGFKLKGLNVSTRSIFIDSGTPITFLPPHVYTRLESAVAKVAKLERVKDPSQMFKLCYNTTSNQSNLPVITAHFSSGDIKLDSDRIFIPILDGIGCFSFFPGDGVAIYGNLAQQNFLVGYDLRKNIVSFKFTDCNKH